MQVKVLKCPECGANLEIEDGRTSCFCQYCGCKIIIEDGKQEYTTNKNINLIKTIHKRYTDDADVIRAKADVIRAKNEGSEYKNGLKIAFVVIVLGMILIALGIGIPSLIDAANKNEGKIKAGYYKDLIGEDYKTVEAHFESAGFTNIELIELNDAGIAFWKEGKVKTISVGGNTSFDTLDWFEPDTKVVISYH